MRKLAWCALLGLGLGGCQPLVQVEASQEDLSELFDPPSQQTVIANYDPLSGILPFPTNLIFSGTTDGTLNAPVADPNDYANPAVAMNTLDGWSGVASAYTSFSGTLDESTVIAGDTVRVFEVNLEGFFLAASSVVRELTAPNAQFGIVGDYTVQVIPQAAVDAEGIPTGLTYDTIAVVPTTPLAPMTSYVVVMTTDILDVNGNQVQRDLIYSISQLKRTLLNEAGESQFALPATSFSDDAAAALEPLRELNSSFETAVASYGIPSSSVAVSWAYTIGSRSTMLEAIAAEMKPTTLEAGPVILNPTTLAVADTSLAGFAGTADIFVGTLEVPFYLDPEDPVNGFWMGLQGQFPTRFYYDVARRGPEMRSTEVVPLLITVPNANSGCVKPADGWPATLFVHTNTQNRSNVLALADAFSSPSAPGANDCVVGIAMDMPVSGIPATDSAAVFGPSTIGLLPWFPKTAGLVKERYAINPDVELDPAGATTFFNPASMLTVRDNIRQAVVDHLAAAKAIPEMRDTWTGLLLSAGIQAATFEIVPNGAVDESGLPVSGPIRELLDAQEAIIVLDPATGAPVSGAGAVTLGTLQAAAAAPATELISGLVQVDTDGDEVVDSEYADGDGNPVVKSGLIYDAIGVAAVLGIAADVAQGVAVATAGQASAKDVADQTAVQLDQLALLGAAEGYINANADVGVDAYTLPDISAGTALRAEIDGLAATASEDAATLAEYTTALGGLLSAKVDAVVAKAQEASGGLAATVATFAGWNDAVNTFAGLAPAVADLPEGVIAALANAYGLASAEGAVSAGMTQQILDLHNNAVALNDAADAIIASDTASPAILAAASEATLGVAAGQADVASGLIESIGIGLADGGTGSLAAFQSALAGLGGDVADTLGTVLGEAGAVAGAVSDCASLVVTLGATGADFTDTNTAVGLTFATIVTALGDGGANAGVGTLVGAVAGAVAAEGQLLQVLGSAWKSSSPFIDADKLAITGHAMGAVVAIIAGSLTDDYASVIASSPTGGMAYAFEKSGTFGPALVAGLGDAVGATPGDPTWEQYFNVFQNVMGQADPLYYVDKMSDSTGVLVFEFEDDSFFPNSDASRPLTGSSPLIEMMGLERTKRSVDGNGGPVRAAVTVNTSNSTADFGTYLSPLLGCPENALACISANQEIRGELHQQTRSMIVNGGKAVEMNALSATGAIVLE